MDLVFVGAGPGNIFSILYLLENNYQGKISVVDKGRDPYKRLESDILISFGGAGGWSDAKYIFSEHTDQPIFDFVSKNEIVKYYKFIQDMILKFHPQPDTINITTPTKLPQVLVDNGVKDVFESGWGEMSIKQSTTWHIGSTMGVELLKRWYDYMVENKVVFYFEHTFLDIKDNNVVTDKNIIPYDKCYLSLGKIGKKDLQTFYKNHNITSSPIDMNLGVRFETSYDDNKIIQDVVDKQYDFKLSQDISPIKNVRTFCSCHGSSEVVAEVFNDSIRVNGHGKGLYNKEQWTGNSNWGIMINEKINGDHIIENIIKTYPNGFVVRNNDNFPTTIKRDIPTITIEEFKQLYGVYSEDVLNFVYKLEDILSVKSWRFYGPEIKESSSRVPLNPNLEVIGLPNVYSIGDSGIGTRGITPAACSGLISISDLI